MLVALLMNAAFYTGAINLLPSDNKPHIQTFPGREARRTQSFTYGMAMGYLRRPGNPCPPLYNQWGVSTPSSAPTSLRTTRDSY